MVKWDALWLRAIALCILMFSAAFLFGGTRLIALGGSAYYILSGAILLAVALLLWRRDRRGSYLFGLFLAGTTLWSLSESGFDFWALLPRLTLPIALGLLVISPLAQRAFHKAAAPWARTSLLIGALFLTGVFGYSFLKLDQPAATADSFPQALPGFTDPTNGASTPDEWPAYGRTPGGARFSNLSQINASNVGRLEKVWSFHVGRASDSPVSLFEVTPLKIDSTLYACNSETRISAIDADTGALKWSFDAKPNLTGIPSTHCRGVAYFSNPKAKPADVCAARIITAAADARLIALDASTGRPCPGFGRNGAVDLASGMGPYEEGYYYQTSAPTIVRGKIVIGGAVYDNQHVGEPSGVIRAFDAISGAFVWAWDMGRPGQHDEPKAGERYTPGTPNAWAPPSADEDLGLVYIPTGNATPDFWGGHRSPEMNQYSSSVVALDAMTGDVRWSFQTTHHDVWDYDVGSQPTLLNLPAAGKIVPALIQPTKRGETFVLDRRTGQPIWPVEERAAPPGDPSVEQLSPTQPYSSLPSMAGPRLTESMMWGITPLDQLYCRIKFRELRYQGDFTPPGLTAHLQYPGYPGGSNWGSIAVDPERHIMIINVNRFAVTGRLLTREEADNRGVRPGNKGWSKGGEIRMTSAQQGAPFAIDIGPFVSPLRVPCQQPPFGVISAVNLRNGKVLWTKRFGTAVDSGPFGMRSMLPIPLGTPNMGGALITRSGLVFIGATQERAFRAYDIETGKIVWRARLSAGGNSTPMTYRSTRTGRQYVVIAAGGNVLLGGPISDELIAYALPDAGKGANNPSQ